MFYDTPFTAAHSGYRVAFRPGEQNICPGCGQSHWMIGRMTAECAFCATALPINNGGSIGGSSLHTRQGARTIAA